MNTSMTSATARSCHQQGDPQHLYVAVFEMPGLSLAVSSMFVLLIAGLILYETSNIIHGGDTNYLKATVTLYVSIFTLFTSLLHLLGFMNSEA